jgi:hypothetical protein
MNGLSIILSLWIPHYHSYTLVQLECLEYNIILLMKLCLNPLKSRNQMFLFLVGVLPTLKKSFINLRPLLKNGVKCTRSHVMILMIILLVCKHNCTSHYLNYFIHDILYSFNIRLKTNPKVQRNRIKLGTQQWSRSLK